MSKKEEIPTCPLHLMAGDHKILFKNGTAIKATILGGYSNAWHIRLENGNEGVVLYDHVAAIIEDPNVEPGEKKDEAA